MGEISHDLERDQDHRTGLALLGRRIRHSKNRVIHQSVQLFLPDPLTRTKIAVGVSSVHSSLRGLRFYQRTSWTPRHEKDHLAVLSDACTLLEVSQVRIKLHLASHPCKYPASTGNDSCGGGVGQGS